MYGMNKEIVVIRRNLEKLWRYSILVLVIVIPEKRTLLLPCHLYVDRRLLH